MVISSAASRTIMAGFMRPVALKVGDERLNNPEPFGQFNLGAAAFLAQPHQPLAEGSNFCATASVAGFVFSIRPTVRLVVVHLGLPTSMLFIHYSRCVPIMRNPLVVTD